jgi:hypothetical protein
MKSRVEFCHKKTWRGHARAAAAAAAAAAATAAATAAVLPISNSIGVFEDGNWSRAKY